MKRRVEKRGFNMSLQEGPQEPRGELGFTLAAVGMESSRSAYLRHAREAMIQSGEPCGQYPFRTCASWLLSINPWFQSSSQPND